jgi:uncharacterized protein (DUF58 family)
MYSGCEQDCGAVTVIGNSQLAERFRQRFGRWLQRRIPPARSVTLDQRRIFIFPSRVGFFFFACLLVMLLAGINYQNNSAYGLTFLLATLFVVAILHSYANLSGLTVRALHAGEGFPGQQLGFELELLCTNRRGHHGLQLDWRHTGGAAKRPRPLLSVAPRGRVQCTLYAPATGRGWFRPGRLRIDTVYPLGLLRCWTWIDLDQRALVYPAPLQSAATASGGAGGDSGSSAQAGEDEFAGLRPYRPGDRAPQIHWKSLARGQPLHSKTYADPALDPRWLDWDDYPGLGVERRLSSLCHECLRLYRSGQPFGLRLPGQSIALGAGEAQRDRVLRALALYGLDGPDRPDAATALAAKRGATP